MDSISRYDKMNNFVRIVYSLSFVSIFLCVKGQKAGNILHSNVSKPMSEMVAKHGNLPPSEAPDMTHLGREHVTEKVDIALKTQILVGNASQTTNETTVSVKTPSEAQVTKNLDIKSDVSSKNDNSHSTGKKGVSSTEDSVSTVAGTNDSVSIPSTPATTMKVPPPQKPKYTETDAGFIPNPPDNNVPISVDNDGKSNRADYVVPIVAVILSVPFVAIIISVLYKRGTDWWQHRNYRRMDFLIDGMYNT